MIVSQNTETLTEIADVIARGGVIAFRTDTIYGLGADPFNREAVRKVKELKGREDGKPILVLISEIDHAQRFWRARSSTLDALVEKFWPGPLTVVGPAAFELSGELTANTGSIGLRLPDDDSVRALVSACGGALTATSANPAGEKPALSAVEAADYFGDEVDCVVDGGVASNDQPSTVVDASSERVTLIREGIIPWSRIQTELNIE